MSEGDEYCWHCGREFDPQKAATEDRETGDTREKRTASAKPQNDDVLAPLVHVLALFFWIFAPLVVFLVTEDGFVKENAANALNWQISYSIYMVVSVFLMLFLVGILTAFVVALLNLVFCVVAAVKAADGEAWKYPLTLEIV
ncbi:MAG: DUF4870 domain-containing protein [Halobacteriales archaeon]|nr:DUF4870 domain-containing protein [Halobacteriales archaeon]